MVKCCALVFGLMTVGGVTASHAQACKVNEDTPLRYQACGGFKRNLAETTLLRLKRGKENCPQGWARHWVQVEGLGYGNNQFNGWVARDYIDCPEDTPRPGESVQRSNPSRPAP
jgi:hypothetical protein